MPTTAQGLRYPASSAAPNVPQDIQNLASDVDAALPKSWALLVQNNPAFVWSPSEFNVWQTVPLVTVTTFTVPAGRTLDIRFDAVSAYSNAGFFFLRLLVNGVVKKGGWWANTRSPVFLASDHLGTGAGVALKVEGMLTSGTGGIECGNVAPSQLTVRIV